jgi:subtilase family serine protease
VPGLGPGLASTGTVTVTIPSSTSAGAYFLLACADHAGSVAESDEANNCGASAASVRVGKPNLVTTAVSDPPASARRGSRFPVTDTVVNQSAFAAGASRTRYYLSVDALRNSKDRLLSGSRAGPALAPSADSTGTVTVTIPSSAPDGIYFLLACADDTGTVGESNESDNCLASAGTVAVRP